MLSKVRAIIVNTLAFLTVGWIALVFPGTSLWAIGWKLALAEVVGWLAWGLSLMILRHV